MNQLKALRVKNFKIEMPDFALWADFSIEVGERIALVGRSGSGKTTFLRALAGLEPITAESRIFLGGEEVTHLPTQKRGFGFVFQEPSLFESMSVVENCAFGLRMQGIEKAARQKEALNWLEKVSLEHRAHASVGTLSGGEKQRVAFIRALLPKPQVILLDEPFSSLDQEMREGLRDEFRKLHALWPAPALLVSHDEGDIRSLATGRLKLEWEKDSPLRKITRVLT